MIYLGSALVLAIAIGFWRLGYYHGVNDTEERWSDAVGRKESSR